MFPVAFVPVTVVKLLDQSPTVSKPDLDVGDGLRLINSDGRTGFGFILCLLGRRAGAHDLGCSAENRETQGELLKNGKTHPAAGCQQSGSELIACWAQLPGFPVKRH